MGIETTQISTSAASLADGTTIEAASGTLRIKDDGVSTAKIIDSAVTTGKIAANAIDGTKIALGSDAAGDTMYYDGTNYVRLAKGTAGQALKMNSGATAPEWGSAGAQTFRKIGHGTLVNGTCDSVAITGLTVDSVIYVDYLCEATGNLNITLNVNDGTNTKAHSYSTNTSNGRYSAYRIVQSPLTNTVCIRHVTSIQANTTSVDLGGVGTVRDTGLNANWITGTVTISLSCDSTSGSFWWRVTTGNVV